MFLKAQLLEAYLQLALGANSPATVVLDSFNGFLQSLDAADFSQSLLPVLDRQLKRTPEAVFSTATHLLAHVTVDLSPSSSAIITMLIPHIKSNNDSIRIASTKLAVQLIRQSKTAEVQPAVVKLFAELKIKASKLPVRTSTLEAIEGLLSSKLNENAPPVALFVVNELTTIAAAEGTFATS